MKIGVNALLWTLKWSDQCLSVIDKCKAIGFDVVEIPLFDLGFDARKVKERLDANRLDGIGCIAIGAGQDITSDDPSVRAEGVVFLKKCVDKVAEWGGKALGGVIASAIGKNVGRPTNRDEWKWSAECLKQVAQFAATARVNLALEVVNRYESYLINTLDQATELIRMVDEPNLKILADTYHMNMEEQSFYCALMRNKDLIGHIHFVENDRGFVGKGHVDWNGVFKALHEMNFQGTGSIESFVLDVPEAAAATNIWRRMVPSADALASEGFAFLNQRAGQYQLR